MSALCFVPFFGRDIDVADTNIINISFFDDWRASQTLYKCEAKSEAFALALISSKLGLAELDDGYLSAECNISEEEIDEIDFASITSVVLGEHFRHYEQYDECVYLARQICQKLNARLFVGSEQILLDGRISLDTKTSASNERLASEASKCKTPFNGCFAREDSNAGALPSTTTNEIPQTSAINSDKTTTNEISLVVDRLQSHSCDGLYVYCCLDEDNTIICSRQFYDRLDERCKATATYLEQIKGTIALASKSAYHSHALIPLSEVKNANNN